MPRAIQGLGFFLGLVIGAYLLWLFFAPPTVVVSIPGRVYGTVRDPDGNKLMQRTVHLFMASDLERSLRTVPTDHAGRYEFADLVPGDYRVAVEATEKEREIQGGMAYVGMRPAFVKDGWEVIQDLNTLPFLELQGSIHPSYPDWTVTLVDLSGNPQGQAYADAKSRFRVRTLHRGNAYAGAFREEISVNGVQQFLAHTEDSFPVSRGQQLGLRAASSRFVIRAPSTADAFLNISVTLVPVGERPDDFWWEIYRARGRAGGNATLSPGQVLEIQGLPYGTYKLSISYLNYEENEEYQLSSGRSEIDLSTLYLKLKSSLEAAGEKVQ